MMSAWWLAQSSLEISGAQGEHVRVRIVRIRETEKLSNKKFSSIVSFVKRMSVSCSSVVTALVSVTLVAAQESRVSKLLNVFNIVTFPNDPCNNGNVYGSCYTGDIWNTDN